MTLHDEWIDRVLGLEPEIARIEPRTRAAVAVPIHPRGRDAEILLMRRAECEGDPWSGHVSFPGGRVEDEDPSHQHAAERETLEEVGLDLARARHLGRLDDLEGTEVSLVVSAYVYLVEEKPPIVASHEVDEAFWVPVSRLADPAHQLKRTFDYRGTDVDLPAIRLPEPNPVIWGITYKFLDQLLDLLGAPIPKMPWRPL